MANKLRCTECGKELTGRVVWLVLSNKTGNYYKSEEGIPEDENQGAFPFGSDCAENVGVDSYNSGPVAVLVFTDAETAEFAGQAMIEKIPDYRVEGEFIRFSSLDDMNQAADFLTQAGMRGLTGQKK